MKEESHFVVIPFLVSFGRNLLTCAGEQSLTLLLANRSSFIRYSMDRFLKKYCRRRLSQDTWLRFQFVAFSSSHRGILRRSQILQRDSLHPCQIFFLLVVVFSLFWLKWKVNVLSLASGFLSFGAADLHFAYAWQIVVPINSFDTQWIDFLKSIVVRGFFDVLEYFKGILCAPARFSFDWCLYLVCFDWNENLICFSWDRIIACVRIGITGCFCLSFGGADLHFAYAWQIVVPINSGRN